MLYPTELGAVAKICLKAGPGSSVEAAEAQSTVRPAMPISVDEQGDVALRGR